LESFARFDSSKKEHKGFDPLMTKEFALMNAVDYPKNEALSKWHCLKIWSSLLPLPKIVILSAGLPRPTLSLVATVLKTIQDRFSTQKAMLPILALGASSGGSFVSQLGPALQAAGTNLDDYISQNAAGKIPSNNYDHVKRAMYISG
jgi:hypothetical protein